MTQNHFTRIHTSPRPKSFPALMEMYEFNYMQIKMLLGDVRTLPKENITQVIGHAPLYIQIQELSRHTTTLLMTYLFHDKDIDSQFDSRPDVIIRIYHDSQQAEVLQHKCHFPRVDANYWSHRLDESRLMRWRSNRFLYKWLLYLRRLGYRL